MIVRIPDFGHLRTGLYYVEIAGILDGLRRVPAPIFFWGYTGLFLKCSIKNRF
jgi:hypothetical protein